MIDPTTVSMIRDIVAIFGVIAGFTYYVLTVQASRRNQQQQLETRQVQLFDLETEGNITGNTGLQHLQAHQSKKQQSQEIQ